MNVKKELKPVFKITKAMLSRCRSKYYDLGDKCGKVLAKTLREQYSKTFRSEIKDKAGVKRIHTDEIAGVFHDYKGLYILQVYNKDSAVQKLLVEKATYLASTQLPSL